MQKPMRMLLAILLFGVTAATPQTHAQEHTMTTQKRATTPPQETHPFVCNLEAMTLAQQQRHERTVQQLRHAVKQIQELPDGYAFRFTSDPALFLAAAEFITLESRCCAFYHFSLEQEPREGAMWLRVTGPKDAKSFIKPVLAP